MDVTIILTYIAMLIFFLLVDYVMIIKFINPMFQANIGGLIKDQFNVLAAGIFYLFYVTGVYWFGTLAGLRSGSVLTAVLSGAFLGLLAYGTFEITNFSMLKGWTIQMVIVDTLWGGILGGATAGVGYYVSRAINL